MSEFTYRPKRMRDPAREQAERDAFLLLFHLHNLCEGRTWDTFRLEQICRDLAFDDHAAMGLSDLLEWGRFLTKRQSVISITPEGVDYIRNRAGRRRSARLGDWAQPTGAFGTPITPW